MSFANLFFLFIYISESERPTWEQSDGLCLEPTTPDPSSILCLEKNIMLRFEIITKCHEVEESDFQWWLSTSMLIRYQMYCRHCIVPAVAVLLPKRFLTQSKLTSGSFVRTPSVNYSGFNGLMWLQLQQMAQLIFLGSFRLNSNHNYFPIAVVAQTLGILGRSTPIIKEKAFFFKTDFRISKKKADCVFTPNQKE